MCGAGTGRSRPAERQRLSATRRTWTLLTARIRACRICRRRSARASRCRMSRVRCWCRRRRRRILIASQAPGTKVHLFRHSVQRRLRRPAARLAGRYARGILRSPKLFAIAADGLLLSRPGRQGRATCRRAANARRPGAAPLMALMPQIELVLTIGLYAQAWHLGSLRGRFADRRLSRTGEPIYGAAGSAAACCRCRIRLGATPAG